MAQITSGLRRLLSLPSAYNLFQNAIGARRFREVYVKDYLKLTGGERVLDIGCGTSEILDFLPKDIEYTGFDLSSSYVDAARKKYKGRGRWFCSSVEDFDCDNLGLYDLVMANGILHHLSDSEANQLCRTAYSHMKKGGRFIAYDNCYLIKQNKVARTLISLDRGRNVRLAEEYKSIASKSFDNVELCVREDILRIPYSYSIIICK